MKISNKLNGDGNRCAWCGDVFSDPRNGVRQATVIWVRKTIRIAGELWRITGSVSATCNDKINAHVITQMSA